MLIDGLHIASSTAITLMMKNGMVACVHVSSKMVVNDVMCNPSMGDFGTLGGSRLTR